MSRVYIMRGAGKAGAPPPSGPVPPVKPAAAVERSFASPFGPPVCLPAFPEPPPAPEAITRPEAATGHQYPATAAQSLSSDERQRLGYLAGQAWAAAIAADPEILRIYNEQGVKKTAAQEHWRHSQCKAATRNHAAGQVDGIRSATRAHYAELEAHFAMLAGDSVRAFNAAMDTGDDGETLRADTKQAAFVLKRLQNELSTRGLHPNYAVAIAKRRFQGRTLLNAKQLWQMIYTLTNRDSAKQGLGNPKNRNKSQRKSQRKAPPEQQPF